MALRFVNPLLQAMATRLLSGDDLKNIQANSNQLHTAIFPTNASYRKRLEETVLSLRVQANNIESMLLLARMAEKIYGCDLELVKDVILEEVPCK